MAAATIVGPCRGLDRAARPGAAAKAQWSYASGVITLQGMRRRMPLLMFILLAIFCLLALGIACACASDHPMQNVDRALSAIPAAAPLVEVWTFSFAALVIFASVGVRQRRADKDTSPAALQCFLF